MTISKKILLSMFVGCAFVGSANAMDIKSLNNKLLVCKQVEEAKKLLDQGADVNAVVGNSTPLYTACLHGSNKMVELFLERGANVNDPIAAGVTPLFLTSMLELSEKAKLLVAYGADIHAKSNNPQLKGETPLTRSWGQVKEYLLAVDCEQKHAGSRVLALEALAKKNGDTRKDGTQRPFNVMSLLKRPLLQEVEEFATCDCPGYEGRGLSSERLNIEYAAKQKKEQQV